MLELPSDETRSDVRDVTKLELKVKAGGDGKIAGKLMRFAENV
jgi:hypothetical protein